jgi:hypothetical protein
VPREGTVVQEQFLFGERPMWPGEVPMVAMEAVGETSGW